MTINTKVEIEADTISVETGEVYVTQKANFYLRDYAIAISNFKDFEVCCMEYKGNTDTVFIALNKWIKENK